MNNKKVTPKELLSEAITGSGVIKEYLAKLKTNSSRKNYLWGIRKYFEAINPDFKKELYPDNYMISNKTKKTIELERYNMMENGDTIADIEEIFVVVCDGEIVEEQPYIIHVQNMETFIKSMQNLSPMSQHLAFTSVKSFLKRQSITFLPTDIIDFINSCKKKESLTDDRAPTKEEMKLILTEASLKYKSAFLCLISSGMRRNELCSLKLDDIDMNVSPARIKILGEYTKSGFGRVVYISNEAKGYLKQWKKIRNKYLEDTCKRLEKQPNMKKDKDDLRLFPFDAGNLQTAFTRLIKNVGLDDRDKTTGRHKLHSHSLRKYFISELSLVIPKIIAEGLAGHRGYMGGAYDKYSEKEVKDYYLKGMHVLEVFNTGIDRSQLTEKDFIIKKMQERDLKHESETKELEKKLKESDDRMKDFLERTKWMSILTKEQKLKLQKEIEEGKLKEIAD